MPDDPLQGYVCFKDIKRVGMKGKEKPYCTIVVTSKALQRRWVDAPDAIAGADGGFKFNFLGWPLTVIGQSNKAHQYAACGFGMHSSIALPQVTDMFSGFVSSTEDVTKKSAKKRLCRMRN